MGRSDDGLQHLLGAYDFALSLVVRDGSEYGMCERVRTDFELPGEVADLRGGHALSGLNFVVAGAT